MPKVTVYCFTGYDHTSGQTVSAQRMATLETIKELKGTPLMETAKEVDTSELDGNGFYPKR